MDSFNDILAAWPSPEALGADIGVDPKLIAVWKHRNRIPSAHWAVLVAAAEKCGIKGVTFQGLVELVRQRNAGIKAAKEAAGNGSRSSVAA